MRKLIEIQYQKQQEKAAAAEPAPEPFKLQRFAHVESRLAQSGVSTSSKVNITSLQSTFNGKVIEKAF